MPAFRKKTFFLSVSIASVIFLTLSSFTPSSDIVNDVLLYTNRYRQSKKLPPLIIRTDLNAIAQKHSQQMANGKTEFGHDGFNKRQKQVEKIFNSCTVAENVAYGIIDGKKAVSLWENSSGHRKNLLGNYKYIGIGIAKDRKGISYYTQIFVR